MWNNNSEDTGSLQRLSGRDGMELNDEGSSDISELVEDLEMHSCHSKSLQSCKRRFHWQPLII